MFVGLTAEGAESKSESQAFLDSVGITWPNGYGARKTIDAFGVQGYPTMFVIGADGKVVWNDEIGGELESAVDEALAALSGR